MRIYPVWQLAHEGGYDVRKGPALWAKFARKYGDQPEVVNFLFGSHSRSSDRQSHLEDELGWNYRLPDARD